ALPSGPPGRGFKPPVSDRLVITFFNAAMSKFVRELNSYASSWLNPATIDYVALCGAHSAVVRGQKKCHGADVLWRESVFQTLVVLNFFQCFIVRPVAKLSLCHNPAGDEGVDADIVLAKIPGQPAGHSLECSFGCGIAGHISLAFVP